MRVRGVDLEVAEAGGGVPFFWGHGLLGSVAQEDAADLLDWAEIARASRLLRYDARGHGRSEATLEAADYRWTELARDLWALADAFGAQRAVLGGLSMGCATALHAAAAEPDRVEGLVLVAPPTAWRTRPRQARFYRGLAAAIDLVGLTPLRAAAWLGRVTARESIVGRLQRSVADQLRRADARAVVATLRGAALSDLPTPARLRRVRAPALVLAWRGDRSHPMSTAEALTRLLPNAELGVARTLDDVRAWSTAIRSFLEGLTQSGPAVHRARA